MGFGYKEACVLLEELRLEGFEEQVPLNTLRQRIAEKTNFLRQWHIDSVIKSMVQLGLVRFIGKGQVLEIKLPAREEP